MSKNHKLRMLAAHLPPYPKTQNGKPVFTRTVVDGSDLIDKHGRDFKVQGEPVNSRKKYLMPVAINVNHFDELQKAWREGGAEAVNEYCRKVKEFYSSYKEDQAQKQKEKQALPNPEDAFGTEPSRCYFCGGYASGYSTVRRDGVEKQEPTCKDHEV